jgi:nucleoside-diphosphate-sugar epimerase
VIELTKAKVKIDFKPLPQDDPKQRQPNITKAKTLLNWFPQVSRQTGMAQTYAYFKEIMQP